MTDQNANGKKRIPKSSNAEPDPNARQYNRRPGPSDNGRGKTPVADHPQWRDYLGKRHILEPVIAAGAWVEREAYTGQDVLVWREKRRDGSPGATRRRLLAHVSSSSKGPKVKWQIPDEKSDEPFYCAGSLDELKRQIATVGGLLYIVEGEVDVWSLHTPGHPQCHR